MSMRHNDSTQKPAISFTERQQGIVAAGLTVLCATLVAGFAALLLWAGYRLISAVSVVVTPLLAALILALLLRPYHQWLHIHLRRSNLLAIPVLFLSILIPAAALLFFFGSLFASQLVSLADYLPVLAERISAALAESNPDLQAFLSKYGLEDKLPLLTAPHDFIAALAERISF
ncbi:MAG: AI-2E family transporter, partial [Kiritimatiellae bacterium]|nr:AI-2E family transporter [Kiritimatiellia bacterium]